LKAFGIGPARDLDALIRAEPGFDHLDLIDLAKALTDFAQIWKRRTSSAA
jgi:hypothetical protein